ncbi:hypothetical protein [Streptomyces sp. NPDC093568]|uniref:hypothetical protein n=1 Tax=Streptomyces sp. NPDC093568 TaxID=3366041 RepID=UPI0037FA00E3
MTTRFDDEDPDGPELAPDDPLAVILRPPADHLAPPPGHYDTLRRRASRRRLVRTAAGAGVTCAVALLAVLQFNLGPSDTPTRPTPPLAPPPATDRTPAPVSPSPVPSEAPTRTTSQTPTPTPTDRPGAATSEPTRNPRPEASRTPTATAVPTVPPAATTAPPSEPSVARTAP